MKILALQGSPRLRGNTAILLSQFVNGARAAGSDVEVINLQEQSIHPCDACDMCECGERDFCVYNDSMREVMKRSKRPTPWSSRRRYGGRAPLRSPKYSLTAFTVIRRVNTLRARAYSSSRHILTTTPMNSRFRARISSAMCSSPCRISPAWNSWAICAPR